MVGVKRHKKVSKISPNYTTTVLHFRLFGTILDCKILQKVYTDTGKDDRENAIYSRYNPSTPDWSRTNRSLIILVQIITYHKYPYKLPYIEFGNLHLQCHYHKSHRFLYRNLYL